MRNGVQSTLLVGMAALCLYVPVSAQEGYPLDGTWRGEWGGAADNRNQVVIVMKWDGETINGTINPGPNSFPFDSAVLNPEDWIVQIEATDRSGGRIEIEGTLENIGSYNRRIEGSLTRDGTAHAFRITRE